MTCVKSLNRPKSNWPKAWKGLKKFEILSERENQRQRAESARSEQVEYDEIARLGHVR